jgi:transcriptional regulatory protein RtcR
MSKLKKNIVIGFLGTTLDRGPYGERRWERWRPTVSLCSNPEILKVDQYEMLYGKGQEELASRIAADLKTVSPGIIVRHHLVEIKDPWGFEEVYGVLLDFANAYKFDENKESYYLNITTGTHVAQICLFLLAESRYFPAKLVQVNPSPNESVDRGKGNIKIIDLDLSQYDKIAQRFAYQKREDLSFLKSGIATKNRAFNQLIEEIEFVASNSKEPILLNGPTGAGKSQLARRIYELKIAKHQIQGKFVELNCATLRGDTAMSTLFGHERGSFTGADRSRSGLLQTANKGLLFLDEIGELGVDEQTTLLGALETKRFLPVGADKESESNFLLICGTNRDLSESVINRSFREDLLARINLWTFNLPGLKDRPEDIEPNIIYELDKLSLQRGSKVTFNKEAKEQYLKFATSNEAIWSANFRDLAGSITRMGTLSSGGRITIEGVTKEILLLKKRWSKEYDRSELLEHYVPTSQLTKLDPFDRVQLEYVLNVCKNAKSLSDAGRQLFAVSRKQKTKANDADRLRKYLSRYEVFVENL